MAMIGKVRRTSLRQKKSVREIARATSLSRDTVRKYLRASDVQEPKYERGAVPTKLGPYQDEIIAALTADARQPKRERRTAKALLVQIRRAGYSGGYTQLAEFIRRWQLSAGGQPAAKAYVPLAFELGEAYQFDWSEEGLVIGGV